MGDDAHLWKALRVDTENFRQRQNFELDRLSKDIVKLTRYGVVEIVLGMLCIFLACADIAFFMAGDRPATIWGAVPFFALSFAGTFTLWNSVHWFYTIRPFCKKELKNIERMTINLQMLENLSEKHS